MRDFREWVGRNPAIGWVIALLACGVAVYFAAFRRAQGDYLPEQMTEMVTIKFTDDNETMDIPRGRLIRELMRTGQTLDPSKGITNPRTGQPTGFPFNKSEWESMVRQINTDRDRIAKQHPDLRKPAPKAP